MEIQLLDLQQQHLEHNVKESRDVAEPRESCSRMKMFRTKPVWTGAISYH